MAIPEEVQKKLDDLERELRALEHSGEELTSIRKAAQEGDDIAKLKLGMMYCEGIGTDAYIPEGLNWLGQVQAEEAAEAAAALMKRYSEANEAKDGIPSNNDNSSSEEVTSLPEDEGWRDLVIDTEGAEEEYVDRKYLERQDTDGTILIVVAVLFGIAGVPAGIVMLGDLGGTGAWTLQKTVMLLIVCVVLLPCVVCGMAAHIKRRNTNLARNYNEHLKATGGNVNDAGIDQKKLKKLMKREYIVHVTDPEVIQADPGMRAVKKDSRWIWGIVLLLCAVMQGFDVFVFEGLEQPTGFAEMTGAMWPLSLGITLLFVFFRSRKRFNKTMQEQTDNGEGPEDQARRCWRASKVLGGAACLYALLFIVLIGWGSSVAERKLYDYTRDHMAAFEPGRVEKEYYRNDSLNLQYALKGLWADVATDGSDEYEFGGDHGRRPSVEEATALMKNGDAYEDLRIVYAMTGNSVHLVVAYKPGVWGIGPQYRIRQEWKILNDIKNSFSELEIVRNIDHGTVTVLGEEHDGIWVEIGEGGDKQYVCSTVYYEDPFIVNISARASSEAAVQSLLNNFTRLDESETDAA